MQTTPRPRLPRRLAVLAAGALSFALAGAAGADTLLTLKAHQDAFAIAGQQQDARDATVEVWIGDGQISRSDDQGKFVMRENQVVIVNHRDRTYTVLDLPVDLAEMLPPGMEQQVEMWKIEAEVTPTEERREIGDWSARRYDIEVTNPMGLAVSTEMWASTEVDIDFEAYHKLARQMLALQPGTEDLVAEMSKVRGFPVLVVQETMVDGAGTTVKTREELVSVEKKEPPADAYGVPEGYILDESPFDGPPPAPPA